MKNTKQIINTSLGGMTSRWRTRMKRIVLLSVLFVLFVLVADGFAVDFGSGVVTNTKAGAAYTRDSDVRYTEGEGPQLLDLYLPRKTADELRPAVLLIHGGWMGR